MQLVTKKLSEIKPYADEYWQCKKCGSVIYEKPYKNKLCTCGGRYKKHMKCKYCGEYYDATDRRESKYCSNECKENAYKMNFLTCDYCGKEFHRSPSGRKTATHYCSKDCMLKARKGERLKRTCECCGKEFEIYKSSLKTNASGRFCSRDCYSKSMMIPGKEYNGFSTAKKQYFSGVNFCALCGTTKGINIHHIIPNRLTQDQSKDNLIPLCRKHHMEIENITREFLDGFEDLDEAKFALNNVLRTYQAATMAVIRRLLRERRKLAGI